MELTRETLFEQPTVVEEAATPTAPSPSPLARSILSSLQEAEGVRGMALPLAEGTGEAARLRRLATGIGRWEAVEAEVPFSL